MAHQRKMRAMLKPGFFYKRDWYDRLVAVGMASSENIKTQLLACWQGRALISSELRTAIMEIGDMAIRAAVAEKIKNKKSMVK
jgi:hypothetical protein